MSKFSTVWVFSDTVSRLADLMGGARMLGEQINVFVLSETDSATAFHPGPIASGISAVNRKTA